jgi:hypothetical protein
MTVARAEQRLGDLEAHSSAVAVPVKEGLAEQIL